MDLPAGLRCGRSDSGRPSPRSLSRSTRTGRCPGVVTYAGPGTPWHDVAGPDEAAFRVPAVARAGRGRDWEPVPGLRLLTFRLDLRAAF